MRADEVDEGRLELHDLLPRPGPRRFDVARQRHAPGSQMHRRERLAGAAEEVDERADPGDVLEVECVGSSRSTCDCGVPSTSSS